MFYKDKLLSVLISWYAIIKELGAKVCLVTIFDPAKIFSLKCLLDAGLQFFVEKMKS